jgi:hypothetical protein
MGNTTSNSLDSNNNDSNDNLNLINSDGTLCDSECRKNQQLTQLKQAYENAKSNYSTAPHELELAKKNYYTLLNGNASYIQSQKLDYNSKAEKITKTMQEEFHKNYKEAIILLQTYSSSYINISNVMELLENYIKENINLKITIRTLTSDIVTNDRKTYYEDQSIDRLKKYYRWIKYIYIFLLIIIIISLFFIPSTITTSKKILITVLIILYPFIIQPILFIYNSLQQKIINLLHQIPNNIFHLLQVMNTKSHLIN